MKINRIIIVFILFTSVINAQFRGKQKTENLLDFDEQKFSWGYYLGGNRFTFKMHPNDNGLNSGNGFTVYTEPKFGFSAGLIGKWRLDENFDFRVEPALHFTQRDIHFKHVKSLIGQKFPIGLKDSLLIKPSDTIRQVKSTYVDIPVFIKFHGHRLYNTRPYIQAGVSWAINLTSNEKKADDNLLGVFRTKTHNFTWQTEAGVEIYFKRFKLTPSIRGIFFFNNELVPDNDGSKGGSPTPDLWAGSLKALYTRAIMFSLKFE
jgi:hypothetical protein